MARAAGFAGLPAAFCCGALCVFAAVPAKAGTSVPANQPLAVEIRATIVERCGLSSHGNPTSAEGDLQRNERITFDFAIDCNTPFRIGVSSANGALRLAGAPSGQDRTEDGFAVAKPYHVGLKVDTDSGIIDAGTCRSDELTSAEKDCAFYGAHPGHGLSSGHATAIDRTGTLTVSWKGQGDSGPRPAAGLYQDTLTVVLGPKT